jgi:ABC-type microcin C transport system permease subunit YejE
MLCSSYRHARRKRMKRTLIAVFIFLLLFVVIVTSSVWADSTQVTILYSNNINGQIYPAG